MDEPTTSGAERVLVIGRSPSVILDAAGILRSKGFHADATNQFDEVLTLLAILFVLVATVDFISGRIRAWVV